MAERRFYQFGPFRLDAGGRLLFRGNDPIPLPPKAADTLLLLVENAGQVVEKDELLKKVWQGAFVEEGSLTRAISVLRKALGEGVDGQEYIATISKRGYRFAAPVGAVSAEPGEPAQAVVPTRVRRNRFVAWLVGGLALTRPESKSVPLKVVDAGEAKRGPPRYRKRFVFWGLLGSAGVMAMVLVMVNAGTPLYRLRPKTVIGPPIRSLAVLPLENLSRDPDQEYFADGTTEELTTEIAQISALNVISHTSVVQYKGTKKSLPQIAQELGVDGVVEGAVRRSGNRVAITVRLIQAPSDRHLWAKSYERDLRDVLDLQREVTHAIVDELQAKLTVPEQVHLARTQTIGSQAHENYLRGHFSFERKELRKSIAYFQQAIQEDANYGLAYAGLANAYISMGQPWSEGDMRPKEVLPRAKAAARKALEIDDSLGEAHLAMARAIELWDWNWPAVEKEYRRALELNQNDAVAHAFFADYLQEMGRNAEALAEGRRAAALDPRDLTVGNIGFFFYTARQYDAALSEFHKALDLDPGSPETHVGLAWVYDQKKMYPEASSELQKAMALSEGHEMVLATLGEVLAKSGNKAEARKILYDLKRRSMQRYISPCTIALVQIGLGERDQAFASLEQAYAERDQWLLYLKADPHFDDLRSDPRFKDLVRRVGLP